MANAALADPPLVPTSSACAVHGEADERIGVARLLQRYMRDVHAPLLLRPLSKGLVLAGFLGLFLLSCAMLPRLERWAGLSKVLQSAAGAGIVPYGAGSLHSGLHAGR